MIVQEVSNVRVAGEPMPECRGAIAFKGFVGEGIEACSAWDDMVVPCEYHPFAAAVHDAYASHRPLILSPDMLWLLVAQGFANHVNLNAEAMRPYFVNFANKEKIVIWRDEFVKGSPANDWAGAYSEFCTKLVGYIGQENHDRIVRPFSTTGLVERAANDLVLMDTVQSYFEFGCCTLCGIPSVTLEGTAEDWEHLRNAVEMLGNAYGVQSWTDKMLPVLNRIARNAAGADDPELWEGIYKEGGGSGGPYIRGWLLKFFPYVAQHKYNYETKVTVNGLVPSPFLDMDESDDYFFGGATSDKWPAGISKVPLTWKYINAIFEMEMVAGFLGYTQDKETRAVRPKIGWAIRDAGEVPVDRRKWWEEAYGAGKVPRSMWL